MVRILGALDSLCLEMRSIIHASGCVAHLLEIQKRYEKNAALLIYSLRALNNICYLNRMYLLSSSMLILVAPSKVQFIEDGGFQLLYRFLKDPEFPENVKLSVSLLLRNIVHLGMLASP